MRTERAALLVLLLAAPAVRAQIPVDALTEVRTIRFDGEHALSERKLRALLQTKDRGAAYGLRVGLGKIPGVPSPAPHPFSPLVLQQDVVRLRQAYAGAGYFLADVRYDVHRDEARNLLDITFVIDEGRPLVLTDVHVTGADSTTVLEVPEHDRKSWNRLVRNLLRQRGKPLAIEVATDGRDRLRTWWRDRGHPLAIATIHSHSDTARSVASLTYRVVPGPFARFGDVDVEGARSLSAGTVRRLTPIESGDAYSAAALERTRLSLRQLSIIRVVNVDVPALAAADTSDTTTHGAGAFGSRPLPVRVQITEGEGHVIGGDIGYVTDGGIAAEANWEHRNFSGGGRSLNFTSTAQTGWLALADNPDERYRLGLALRQPGFLKPQLAAVLAPFVEYRDDTQDRSTQYGVNLSLVRQVSQFQSASLSYEIADREIHEYRFGDLASGEIDLLTFLTQVAQGALDTLGTSIKSSTFTLSGITGKLDHAANPRLGFILRPAVQVTAPNRWSSTSFWRADVSANAFLPLQRHVTLAARGALGRLFPFGKSVPAPGEDPTNKFLQLRDEMFTSGGTGDVRGWENRLLGPKVPDVRFTTDGTDSAGRPILTPHTDSYVPLGGLERLSFSVELQVPLPGMGPNFGGHVFLDGGRVRTEDHRFDLQQGEHGQENMFYATGAGVDIRTPVGPIKMGVGYKLNPSLTDLVDPAVLLQGAAQGKPLDELPREQSRRWQFYLAIGASY